MTLEEYLSAIDDLDPNTTAPQHIAEVARRAANCRSIVELGTHQGISTAAIALAAPTAAIYAVDWDDTAGNIRNERWAAAGIPAGFISQVHAEAGDFIRAAIASSVRFGMVFHDACHGDAVIEEYMDCAKVADIVAIHDFELLSPHNRERVESVLSPLHESSDARGRVLFVGGSK